jgi:hypothetical protein
MSADWVPWMALIAEFQANRIGNMNIYYLWFNDLTSSFLKRKGVKLLNI